MTRPDDMPDEIYCVRTGITDATIRVLRHAEAMMGMTKYIRATPTIPPVETLRDEHKPKADAFAWAEAPFVLKPDLIAFLKGLRGLNRREHAAFTRYLDRLAGQQYDCIYDTIDERFMDHA